MSKSVKRILSVAAVIAIPFAAPYVASMMASSAFFAPMAAKLGTAGMSALAGAGMGAGKAAIFGEDVGKGALFGGVSGGLAGLQTARAAEAAEAATAAEAASAARMTMTPPPGPHDAILQAGVRPMPPIEGMTAAASTTDLASQGSGFMEAIKKVPEQIAAKYKDPKALADLTLRAAGQLAGSAASMQGLSDQEMQLVQAQARDLEEQRRQNGDVFRARLSEAQQLIGESAYFDPEYFGLQGARQAQMAGDQAKRAGLRGMTGDRRATAQRQYDLGTARNTGSAYDSGYQRAVGARLQTRAAGLAAFPNAYPSSSGDFDSLMKAYGMGEDRKRQKQQDIGKFLDPLINPKRDQEVYDDEVPQGA